MTDANHSDVLDGTARPGEDALSIDEVGSLATDVLDNVTTVIVGQDDVIEHVVVAMLARGHVLLEDVPGVGKTMLARSIARSFDCSFKRVQFTPDLLPADITGVNVFDKRSGEFEFQPGPIFANVVLGDEINRAPPKTQSALLEAMAESQVTVDGTTREVPSPYTVIATQNAVEPGRTYELPLAEVDRFMKKLQLGYPGTDEEIELLDRVAGEHPIESLSSIASANDLSRARDAVSSVTVERPIREYVTSLAGYTRENAELGASPRAAVALLRAGQARAAFEGRAYVVPDDVKVEASPVLAHRLRAGDAGRSGVDIVADALETVPVP
ncbi:MoxR-like ATPase [Natronoarchaeum philippinense]|uniref:MoxR-like ATPase n=1 Tax=Natronoarchaeum philippinense TaxID=558529 RepID=A0A285NRV6_NATPI|nr:MoxR family ATPase [Natronoarchaeum philippinense]SNZ12225.1 MoxR-like ATPase [Natronoarchaeum philippinense]